MLLKINYNKFSDLLKKFESEDFVSNKTDKNRKINTNKDKTFLSWRTQRKREFAKIINKFNYYKPSFLIIKTLIIYKIHTIK